MDFPFLLFDYHIPEEIKLGRIISGQDT